MILCKIIVSGLSGVRLLISLGILKANVGIFRAESWEFEKTRLDSLFPVYVESLSGCYFVVKTWLVELCDLCHKKLVLGTLGHHFEVSICSTNYSH